MRPPSSWLELFRGLGEGLIDLFFAEAESLAEDLRTGRRQLLKAALLFIFSIGVTLVAIIALGQLEIELLATVLPKWQAVGIVLLQMLLIALVLWLWGRRTMQSIESPKDTVQRHVDDHVGWWRANITGGNPPGDEGEDEP